MKWHYAQINCLHIQAKLKTYLNLQIFDNTDKKTFESLKCDKYVIRKSVCLYLKISDVKWKCQLMKEMLKKIQKHLSG